MAAAKPKKPVKASDMSPELSLDYSGVIRAIYSAKTALANRFPIPDGSAIQHLTGKKYIKYSPSAKSTHAKSLRALDKAAELVHELAKQAKVKEV